MKCLIIEDTPTAQKQLEIFLNGIAICTCADNGKEGVIAFKQALKEDAPYDMICLDIMMPLQDGHETLRQIREIEEQHDILGLDGVKVIMTTALDDSESILGAFREGCESYIVKPVRKIKLITEMQKLGFTVQISSC